MHFFTASYAPTGVIAFHACLSFDSSGPLDLPAHHTLRFSVDPVNWGNGYNALDGIFTVPASGTYVFTWSIMYEGPNFVYILLMKNNAESIGIKVGVSPTPKVLDAVTGIVVADVNQGDHVFLRLGQSAKLLNTPQSTFSGWLLY